MFFEKMIGKSAVCGVLLALALAASGCGASQSGALPAQSGESGKQSVSTEDSAGVSGGADEAPGKGTAAVDSSSGETARETAMSGEAASGGSMMSGEANAGATVSGGAMSGEANAGAAASGGSMMSGEANMGATASGAAADSSTDAGRAAASESGSNEENAGSKGIVVIDPGHQGQENPDQEPVGPGASSTKAKVSSGTSGVASGVPEYQLTLDIGLKLRDELRDRGYEVIMVRETNEVDISNSERAQVANEVGADVFVRIHANGVGDGGRTGAMTICQTPGNPYNGDLYEKSRALSDCILDAYVLSTGIDYEYVWETDSMSGINWSEVPVTIIEMGYMSNGEEDLKMQEPEMQEKMVDGIANGIDAYIVQYPRKDKENE